MAAINRPHQYKPALMVSPESQNYAILEWMANLPLDELIETLELLAAQAQAYERALPPDNYPARAAVAALGELARLALNEAQDLATSQDAMPDHSLSPRELEVLGLAARGLTNKEIAYRLNLSERTVQFHLRSVFNKTATNSRAHAVALAVANGWLTPKP